MTSVAKLKRPALALVVFFALLLSGCEQRPSPVHLSGGVFGTTWSLTYLPPEGAVAPAVIQSDLEAVFAAVNSSMNHYAPDSTITHFNKMSAGETVEVDWDFSYVLMEALKISKATGGAYDVTVSPLSNLWGFGPDGPRQFPSQSDIDAAKMKTGADKLLWDSTSRQLGKTVDGVALDFSSIAKGYAVDLGADTLLEHGIQDFMFEIGGEINVHGKSPRGDMWRIAVERPESGGRSVQAAMALTDTGVATSGDYRNYFERDGERFSHLIDPRTGEPIHHRLVSVTVVGPSTGIADAWATALIVLGPEAALRTAQDNGLSVYMLNRKPDGELEALKTESFDQYLVDAKLH